MELGRVGIWSGQLRRADPAAISEAAAELDELGFGAIWVPGGHGGDVFGDVGRLLAATTRATVATGILNVWMHTPDEAATGHATLTSEHPGRFLLGLGVSHEPPVTNSGQVYERRSPRCAPTSMPSTPPTHRYLPTSGCSPRSAPACSSWHGTAARAPTRTS